MLDENLCLGARARRKRHRPGIALEVAPFVTVHRQEQMRHLAVVDVFDDRRIGACAQHRKHEGHLLLLDQTTGLLEGLGRVEAIVGDEVIDFPTGNAALRLVEHTEIGVLRLVDRAKRRDRPAERGRRADLDLGRGHARGFLSPRGDRGQGTKGSRRRGRHECASIDCCELSPAGRRLITLRQGLAFTVDIGCHARLQWFYCRGPVPDHAPD